MTETEAKELLISGMNYAAYKEAGTSLFVADRNRLFGEEHYSLEKNTEPSGTPSPWGDGEMFEKKMAQLLKWALKFGTSVGDYEEAIRTLSIGDHYLNRIVERVNRNRNV